MAHTPDEQGTAVELRDRALALILKARAGEDPQSLLAHLGEERRARIETLLAEAPADAEAELRQLRARELAQLDREHEQRFGPAWSEISPALRFWAWRGPRT